MNKRFYKVTITLGPRSNPNLDLLMIVRILSYAATLAHYSYSRWHDFLYLGSNGPILFEQVSNGEIQYLSILCPYLCFYRYANAFTSKTDRSVFLVFS